jgi:hypothetical protein
VWNTAVPQEGLMYRIGGIVAAIVLALALAPSALADFPFTAPGSPAGYSGFHSGTPPDDISGDDNDWKFAATSESVSPWKLEPRELFGVRGAHVVDADQTQGTAWKSTTGRPDVTLAVLDSGIKWNDRNAMHDLRFKLRLNKGELPTPNVDGPALITGVDCSKYNPVDDANGDGIFDLRDFACDDRVNTTDPRRAGPADYLTPQDLIIAFSNHDDADGNGFVDDVAGWDFLDNDNDPYDDVQYGHGTGEALDSSAEANNGPKLDYDHSKPPPSSQSGACPNCTFVPLRVGDSFVADVNNFAQATLYAVDNDVLVVQEALGTLNNSLLARRAVEYAYGHGVAIIASAADEAAQHHNWPSNYPHTIVVNSVTQYSQETDNHSYLQFNGCTNFSTHVTLAIPSTSCSSNATGVGAGFAGLIYSEALNAKHAGDLSDNDGSCTRPDGSKCLITPNEVRQLMASGELQPAVSDANSPDTKQLSDDVDFVGTGLTCTPVAATGCTDPNRNFPASSTLRPVPNPAGTETRSYPARTGFDEFYGYGRANMHKAVDAVSHEKTVPPEAEITSPDWYRLIDPDAKTLDVRGEAYARGRSYTCTVEVAPGSEPAESDFQAVPSSVCDGKTARTAAFSGVVASLSVPALKARFPSTDFKGSAPPAQANDVPDGGAHQNNRPNVEPFGFTVRLKVTTGPAVGTLANPRLTGQDRRNLYLHRDASLIPGWPKQLPSDGASSPALADLDGDNRNELIFGTSDGTVHAMRRDGSELAGWPVRVDPLPLHTGERAFKTGGVPAGSSHGAILASPSVIDLNHDGSPEVVVADMRGKVYVWSSGGHLRWKREANPNYSGKPLHPFENVRRGHRYRTQHGFIASPVVADLDGSKDGRLEVIAAGMDRHVYAWHAGGDPVHGFPAMVVDREKISAVDPTTHVPTFKPMSDDLNQGSIIDTPAVGDLNGDGKPEIVVGTNEEYSSADDGGLNSGVTTPTGPLIDLLGSQVGLDTGNTRVYALKSTGDPGAVSLDNSIFLWRFKVGVFKTELLPVVGEGVTGAPVIGKVACGPDNTPAPKVGVIPDAGLAYLLNADGSSCYGESGGKANALATEFAVGAGKYDTPALAAVGHPAFGQIDPAGGPSFLAPVAGILRALDAAVNEYQGGQDMVGAWNTNTGEFHPGYPSPVNDLQFLTGPSTADVNASSPGQEVLGGTASLDLNALSGAGLNVTGWPKFTGDWMVTNPVIGSFGADETAKSSHQSVVAITRAGTIFAYDTDAPTCSPASWPRFHHDNASSGVLERDAVSPGRPTSVTVGHSTISFKAPGDDLMCGKATKYQAVTSNRPIKGDFSGAIPIPAPAPGEPGSTQKLTLPASARRYVALRAVDDQGNVGRAFVVNTGRGTPPGCRDRTRPRSTIRTARGTRHRLFVRGSTRDRGCRGSRVKRLRVTVARLRGHRCQFVTRRGRLTHTRSCHKPVLLRARRHHGWTVRISHAHLKRGRYRARVRATDAAGNWERLGRHNQRRFRIR